MNYAAAISTDAWNSQFYGSMSAAYEVRSSVGAKVSRFFAVAQAYRRLGGSMNSLNGKLEQFLRLTANPDEARETQKKSGAVDQRMPSPQDLIEGAGKLGALCETLESLNVRARNAGLLNNSRVANHFRRLEKNISEIRDTAEWIRDLAERDQLRETFREASLEHERGETTDIYSLV